MKSFIIAVLVFACIFSTAKGQFAFGVNTDFASKSAYFGYQFDNFVPYLGVQFFNGSLSLDAKTKYLEYDYETNTYGLVDDNFKNDVSGTVFMPYLGCKYFFAEKNKLKPYINVGIFKPVISGSMEIDGLEDEDFNDFIDNISIWGFSFGFGTEYFIDKNFSLGGEFGFNMLLADFEETTQRSENPDEEEYNWEDSYSSTFNLGMTYARISLNYYFGD